MFSNMKDNDEVVENICILFSELVEYGKYRQSIRDNFSSFQERSLSSSFHDFDTQKPVWNSQIDTIEVL